MQKAEICKMFEIIKTIYSHSERSEKFWKLNNILKEDAQDSEFHCFWENPWDHNFLSRFTDLYFIHYSNFNCQLEPQGLLLWEFFEQLNSYFSSLLNKRNATFFSHIWHNSRVRNKRWVCLFIFEKFWRKKIEKWPSCLDWCEKFYVYSRGYVFSRL